MQTKKDLENLSDDIVRLTEGFRALRDGAEKTEKRIGWDVPIWFKGTRNDADILVHALLWYGHKVTCRIRKLERRKAKEDETQSL